MKQIQAVATVGLMMAAICGAVGRAAAAAGQPIYTSKNRFRIPYRYDRAELARIGAAEIRLYVSADGGLQWRHAQSVAPGAGKFEFVAPGDGEYWFSVRTLDAAGRLHPPQGRLTAGLIVVVDSTPPVLQLTLDQPQPGRVELRWHASDRHLDVSALKLQYRQGEGGVWQPVRVRPTPNGQTAWSLPNGGVVAVRGSVADLASNVTHVERQIRIAPVSRRVPKPEVPDFSEPIAHGTTARQVSFPNSSATGEPAARVTSNQLEPGSYTLRPDGRTGGGWPTIVDGAAPAGPPSEDRHPAGTGSARTVNSTRFRIAYQVEQVGPSGIGTVELYITQNDGKKWWRYGQDADHQSPFEVEVPGDGVYGFAIRVVSGVGLAPLPPRPGEKPDVVVTVDQTPPEVQFLSARQGEGASADKVLIEWKLNDASLAEKPIFLAYSASAEGPWTPITDWQPDSGRYVWTVDERVSGRVYISVQARDRAGNLSRAVTPEPVLIDLSRPTARIVDVEPDGSRR